MPQLQELFHAPPAAQPGWAAQGGQAGHAGQAQQHDASTATTAQPAGIAFAPYVVDTSTAGYSTSCLFMTVSKLAASRWGIWRENTTAHAWEGQKARQRGGRRLTLNKVLCPKSISLWLLPPSLFCQAQHLSRWDKKQGGRSVFFNPKPSTEQRAPPNPHLNSICEIAFCPTYCHKRETG